MSFTTAAVKIGDSLQSGLDAFFAFLPNLVGFLVILIVGYLIAKIVKAVVSKLFEKLGLDKALHSGQLGEQVEKVSPGAKPSKLIGSVAFWLIFVFVLTAAIGALKIPAVTSFMNDVLAYLPNVIAAVVIFVLAGAIAGGVAALVAKTMGDTPTGKLVGAVVPILVMGIATFMILDQLGIAPQIVTITYAALMGSAALGLALAFGLGGRQLAGDILRDAYNKGDEKKDDAKRDLEKGKERGEQQAQRARETANSGSTQSNASTA
jgi:small-conductance mechanosensitive channel